MYEGLNQWAFVVAAYVIGFGSIGVMAAWSWVAMKRAEAVRERARGKPEQ